jgi:AcrR family transcriptional regulator
MPYRETKRTAAKREKTREAIVAGALDLVASGGYAAVSMAAVASRAGIAVGSVYNYFPSKADLFAEVFRRASGHELATTRASAAEAGSARECLVATIATFTRRSLRGRRLAWALLAEPVDQLVEVERLAFRRAYRDLFAKIVEDGIAAGELPDQDVELTAAALVGAIGEALVGPLSPVAAASDPDEVLEALLPVCLRAVGAKDESTRESALVRRQEGTS